MLKKLFKVGMVMSLMMTTMTAFAQDDNAEYANPRYSLKSNWSLGGGLVGTYQTDQSAMGTNPINGKNNDFWRRNINVGGEIFAQHTWNYMLAGRYRLNMPTFWKGRYDNNYNRMVRFTTVTAEMHVSLLDWIKGYNPERRNNVYVFAGAGAAFANVWMDKVFFGEAGSSYNQTVYHVHEKGTGTHKWGHLMPVIDLGAGYKYRINEHLSAYGELEMNFSDFETDKFFKLKWYNLDYAHFDIHMGVMYQWGLSAEDKAIAAQKSLLSQENFDALNSRASDLENQVASARNNEKKLENRIAQLEDQLKDALANQDKGGNTSADAKKLQATIDQIKADQLNFYGMPFSVLYAVDDWHVSESEMEKVKAVARVMKDNSNAKITVVGFADYTGSDQYNMKLSEKRANEVKRLLTKKYGIAEDRIKVDYKGKSVAFGDIQYALNRRVSFYRVID